MATNEQAIKGNLNRRARFYGGDNAPQLDVEDIFGILAFYDRRSCKSGEPGFSFDHVKPLKLGGENIPENIQLLTEDENKAKRDEEIDYRQGRICTREWLEQWKQEQNEAKGAGNAISSKSTEQTDKLADSSTRDWGKIKTDYVTGEISLRDLAKKHAVSFNTLKEHALFEDWNAARTEYRNKITTETQQKLAARDVSARVIAAETAQSVIASWLAGFGGVASAADAVSAAKLLLLIDGEPTERIANIDETDLDASDIISAAGRIAARAERKAAESDYSRGDTWQDGSGAGWTD